MLLVTGFLLLMRFAMVDNAHICYNHNLIKAVPPPILSCTLSMKFKVIILDYPYTIYIKTSIFNNQSNVIYTTHNKKINSKSDYDEFKKENICNLDDIKFSNKNFLRKPNINTKINYPKNNEATICELFFKYDVLKFTISNNKKKIHFRNNTYRYYNSKEPTPNEKMSLNVDNKSVTIKIIDYIMPSLHVRNKRNARLSKTKSGYTNSMNKAFNSYLTYETDAKLTKVYNICLKQQTIHRMNYKFCEKTPGPCIMHILQRTNISAVFFHETGYVYKQCNDVNSIIYKGFIHNKKCYSHEKVEYNNGLIGYLDSRTGEIYNDTIPVNCDIPVLNIKNNILYNVLNNTEEKVTIYTMENIPVHRKLLNFVDNMEDKKNYSSMNFPSYIIFGKGTQQFEMPTGNTEILNGTGGMFEGDTLQKILYVICGLIILAIVIGLVICCSCTCNKCSKGIDSVKKSETKSLTTGLQISTV